MKYQIDEKGFYGDFGGAYIPEMLFPNVEELRKNYIQISETKSFQKEFQSLLDKDFKDRKLHPNQVIKAKIIDILKAHCVVDVRGKSEGLIPLSEFKADEVAKLKVGDSIPVYLERLEGREGEIVLRYSKAKSFAAWQKCVDAFEKEEELTGKIVNKIKGGYIVALFDQAIFSFSLRDETQ